MTRLLILLSILLIIQIPSVGQKKKNAKVESKNEQKGPYKSYQDVITSSSISKKGLWITHQVEEKVLFEISDSMLDTDILLVSRIAQLPDDFGGGYINAGSKVNEQLVRWSKRGHFLDLRSISFVNISDKADPIHASVQQNNLHPIIFSAKIETVNKDTTGFVIDVTNLFTKEIPSISPMNASLKKRYQVGSLDRDRSFVESVKSYPQNVEVRHLVTYPAKEPPSNQKSGTISILMNQSMILLPEEPMQPRHYDHRVGWFTLSKTDFSSPDLKADQVKFIRRWKLEPKDEAAYRRGELVEPKKQIVYYLDPATPKVWRPYFKQGVEDWNLAFETAGFKNAIVCKDPPTSEQDPEFSPEDVRYSVIRYVASDTRNAVGPSVTDPRSGEIIESDIIWYHNHLRSYRNRFLIEAGAQLKDARSIDMPLKYMGEMIRMVIAHEVGHALGLPHNMKASAAYPTDSLRSGSFTQKMGIAASIMDYARVNYIAQPGDEGIRFIRKMGPYDHYAINWGYRFLPDASGAADELSTLNEWIESKSGDPIYEFGSATGADPHSQTESLGRDNILASRYGLANLKRVVPNLVEWVKKDNENYEDLAQVYRELIGVWTRYIGHVTNNIGGMHEIRKDYDQPGIVYTPVSKDIQEEAMDFLAEEAFITPDWLLNKDILQRIEPSGAAARIRRMHERSMITLLNTERLIRLSEAPTYDPNAYRLSDMMSRVRGMIWTELRTGLATDVYRRNVQRVYLTRMAYFIENDKEDAWWRNAEIDIKNSDIRSSVTGQLKELARQLGFRLRQGVKDTDTRHHYEECLIRITNLLELKN